MARNRVWTDSERQRHSEACRSKDRLTAAQKLEIVKLAETGRTARGERVTQTQLSVLFNKVCEQLASLVMFLPAERHASGPVCLRRACVKVACQWTTGGGPSAVSRQPDAYGAHASAEVYSGLCALNPSSRQSRMTISRVLRPSSVAKIKGLAQGVAVTPTTSEPQASREEGSTDKAALVVEEEARRQELAADWSTPITKWAVHREAARARVDEDQRKMSAAKKFAEKAVGSPEIFATTNLVLAVLHGGRSAQSQTDGRVPPTLNLLSGPLAGMVDASLHDLSHISSGEAMAQHAPAHLIREPQDVGCSQAMLARRTFQQGLSDPHGSWVPAARQLPILPPVKWPHGM